MQLFPDSKFPIKGLVHLSNQCSYLLLLSCYVPSSPLHSDLLIETHISESLHVVSSALGKGNVT